jgi:hypothetical protein
MARPKKEIDEKQVIELAKINCTMGEMAAVLGCSVDTLERRFAEVIKEGREQGKMSLKRKQYEVAMSGNVSMLIWLGKNTLGQRDTPEGESSERPHHSIYRLHHDRNIADKKTG